MCLFPEIGEVKRCTTICEIPHNELVISETIGLQTCHLYDSLHLFNFSNLQYAPHIKRVM